MFLDPLSTDIIKPSIGPPTLENPFESVNLFPTIPATSPGTNNNSDFFTYAQGLLDKDVNPIAAPLYDVTKEQKERYDNPYLAYTPSTQGAKSIEGIYGMYQGAGEQLLNGVLKGGVKAIGTFLESFVAVPNQIDSLRKGDVSNALFAESSSFNAITNWMDSFENSLPNYLTDIEQERPWYINAFTPTGAANFWGDTIIKNGGFMIGALASAAVVDGAITLATGGLGAEVALIDFGRRLGSTIPKMKSAFRGLSKVAALGKTDDVIGIMNTGENLLEATKIAKQTNTLAQLGKAGHFAATTYFSTQGEAMIEGYHTYVDTKTKLLEEAISRGETLSPELLAGIEDTASNAGKMTAIFNAAVLTPSNMIQFPKLMGWKKMTNLTKKIDNPYIKYDLQEEGLKAINTYSRKKAVANVLKDVGLKSFLPEGLEEGSQYFIGNSLHDYYIDKFNNKTKAGLGEYMLNALPKTLGEGEFWKEFFIGAISSSTFGGLFPGSEVQTSIKANLIGAKARTDGYVSSINDNLDKFNAAAAQLTSFGELVNFDATPAPGVPSVPKAPFDFINKHESAYKAFHRVVSDAATFGQLETLKDSINDLKELSLEEFNKLSFVGTGLPGGEKGVKTETEKEAGLNQMLIEIDKIQEDLDAVEESFKINPFNNESQKKRLKDFGLKEEELDNAVYSLFQEFKKNQVYTIGRLRNIQDSQNSFFNELKFGANLDPDSIDNLKLVLLNIQDQPSLQSYLEYKSRVLQTLNTQYDLYTTEGTKNPVNAGKIKRAKDSLTRLITYLNNFNLAQELTQEDKDAITEAIFVEEFGENQANLAYLANMQALQLIRQGAEEELKFANEKPEEFAKKMQEVTEELTRQYNEDKKTPEQKEKEKIEGEEQAKKEQEERKEKEEKAKVELEERAKKQKEEAAKETIVPISIVKSAKEEGEKQEEDDFKKELLEKFIKERTEGTPAIKQDQAVEGQFYFKKNVEVLQDSTGEYYVMAFSFMGEKNSNGLNKYKPIKIFLDEDGSNLKFKQIDSVQAFSMDIIPVKPSKKSETIETTETTEPVSQSTNLEAEKQKITLAEFNELKRLVKFFLENPKEPSVTSSVVNKYPEIFKVISAIEKRRQEDLKRYDERDRKSLEAIMPNNPNHPTFKVGMKFNQGMKINPIETRAADNYDGREGDYEVITKIISPAEFDANEKMTKSAKVEVTLFNTKEDADKAIQEKYEDKKSKVGQKQKEINVNYDKELDDLKSQIFSKPKLESTSLTDEVEEEGFETKTFPKYPAEPVVTYDLKTEEGRAKLIEDIRNRSKKVILEKKHYKVLNRIYQRVTSVFSDKEFEPTAVLNSGAYIGTKLDEIVRKMFSTDALVTYEEYKADFEGMYTGSEQELRTFIDKINTIKTKMKERGETVLSDDIKLYSNKYGYAGTVDLISIDSEGKVRIYDLKTFRRDPDLNDAYEKDKRFGDTYRQKHTKQLSLYSQAFFEMFGIEIPDLEIIRVKVDYQGGDVKTSELALLDSKIIEKDTDIEGIITSKSKEVIRLTENITEFLGDKPDLYDFFVRAIKADIFTINCN